MRHVTTALLCAILCAFLFTPATANPIPAGSISLKPGGYDLDADDEDGPEPIVVEEDSFRYPDPGGPFYHFDPSLNAYTALLSAGGIIWYFEMWFLPPVWPFPGVWGLNMHQLTPTGKKLMGVIVGHYHGPK